MYQFRPRLTWSSKLIALVSAVLLTTSACAESSDDKASPELSAQVLELYIENRTRGANTEVTAEQRKQFEDEVADLYLLADRAEAQGLDEKTETAAQIELQRLSILASALAGQYLESHPASEAELQAEYEKQISGYQPQQYKARHILVETEDAAKDVIGQLNEGADFQELAKEKSTGPSGPNGGDLGWFPPDSMVKPFSDAVIALEDGAYTAEPVQTQFGWHVILREQSRTTEPPAFEEVKDRLRPVVEQKKLQDYLASLRSAKAGGAE